MKTDFTSTMMKFHIFAISFFGFNNFLNAQITATWKGGVDTNFYNEKNWDKTDIDFNNLSGTDLIIGAGNPNNPVIPKNKDADKLVKRSRTLTTNLGANVIIVGEFFSNGSANLNGTITVDAPAALFNMRKEVYLGKGTTGALNINAGKAVVKNILFIGNGTGGDGLATLNSGTSLQTGRLEIGTGQGNPTGNLKIKGTVTVETDLNIGILGHISINGAGKLIVMGNKEEILKAWVKSKTIGCTIGKVLQVNFDGTKTTVNINENPLAR